jgi:transcriptional regulator with AAA-type ATPase domain
MPLLTAREHSFLEAVSRVSYCNPFLPELLEFERQALGEDFVEEEPIWSMQVADPDRLRGNTWKIVDRLQALIDQVRERLEKEPAAARHELELYEDALLNWLYYRYHNWIFQAGYAQSPKKTGAARWGFYTRFLRDWDHYFRIPAVTFPTGHEPKHTFACYYQIVRAFHNIFEHIIGNSLPAARLRAAVWQSIFTHDIRRYRRTLFERMGDFATLITGPSGTGKELVARAVALSRYVPFDDNRLVFEDDLSDAFHPINVAALPATLVESELFGHKRGAFTGAVQDKRGWLEACTPLGAVFLDEIGDLDPEIQVKLLRVIETRRFHAVGDTAPRRFQGKLIAATNRDLSQAIRQGRFREDLYYRLCSDLIVTPSLSQQIRESPGVLPDLVLFMARRVAGPEADSLASEAEEWIVSNLGPAYEWPGNYRELEQCVRNLLIRKEYRPARVQWDASSDDLFQPAYAGRLTASELLSRYCTLIYAQTGSYEETARRLDIDRRTVKGKIDAALLQMLRDEGKASPGCGRA